jgi:hypothetical protein
MDYWYDAQLRKFIKQFMAIFSTFSVKISEDAATQVIRKLPTVYGGSSRMVQSIIRNNSENMANTVPMMSCYVQDLQPNSEYRLNPHGSDTVYAIEKEFDEDAQVYKDEPGNRYAIKRLMPVPYLLTMNLDIATSNTEQKLMILEQILVLFNPSINLLSNDNIFDWASLSYVELTGISWSSNAIPVGTEENIDISTLTYTMPIYLGAPSKVSHQKLIHTIIASIAAAADGSEIAEFVANQTTPSYPAGTTVITGKHMQITYENGRVTLKDSVSLGGATLTWLEVLKQYGKFTSGASQLRLRVGDDPLNDSADIIGLLTDTGDVNSLAFAADADSLPSNSQGSVDMYIDPSVNYPGDGTLPASVSGQKYLVSAGVTNDSNWGGLTCSTNDIIAFTTSWAVSFDASATTSGVETVYNSASTQQLSFNGTTQAWAITGQGTYSDGFWRIYL